jgi:hypothetical protein
VFGNLKRIVGVLAVGAACAWCAPFAVAQDAAPAEADAPAETQVQPNPADAEEASDSPIDRAIERLEAKLERKRQAEAEQLAAAQALAENLDALLDAQGMLATGSSPEQRAEAVELATRAGLLARSSTSQAARYLLLQTQARIYNALANDAAAQGEELEFSRRLRQLRSAGQSLRLMDRPPQAASAGAFWVLLSDLADTNRGEAPIEDRQALARELLANYIETYRDDPEASDLLIDARLSLARLHDQAGNAVAVAQQLAMLGELPEGDPRLREARALRASIDRIGRKIELDAQTTSGTPWQLDDYDDGPVLLHIYTDGVPGNPAIFDGLMRKIARSARGGFTVVSLRVGPAVQGSRLPTWPTLVMPGREPQLLQTLGVTAAPTFVWIDRDHRIAAIGQTLDVFYRRPANRPAPVRLPEPDDQAPAGDDRDSPPVTPAE